MNYLQLKDDGTFAREEARLAEFFGEGNYVPFHAKAIRQRRLILLPGDFVAGGLQVTLPALKRLGVDIYKNDDYPERLSKYLYRNVWASSLKRVREKVEAEGEIAPVFIKPLRKVKRFTGRVVSTMDDLAPLGNVGGSVEIYCSDPVRWVSEYRVPVVRGEVRGCAWYDGDRGAAVDMGVVGQMVKDYGEAVDGFSPAPSAYCLDVGVLETGETALVEVNDAFSVGMYDGMEACYPDLLVTRWKELTIKGGNT
jgi:hypothetical protein